ncbi:SMP-30/gluconolactonase/LRE family protein [Aliiglaciecola litoralis]|uniref:SMP-30/gluconolactonase/LRE family protein n=1 Tax=Aliiglaciecola litoralis TaxID=582857 RepID=A0ABP3WYP1_9ALTE
MSPFHLAESPLWHAKNNQWIWTDILQQHIFLASLSKTKDVGVKRHFAIEQMVSNIVLLNENSLLLSAEKSHFVFDLKSETCTPIAELPHSDLFRCNDGSVGPDGKYWFGTMEKKPTGLNGDIYSLDAKGQLVAQNIPIGIPNSFIWVDDYSVLVSDSFLQKTFKVNLNTEGKLDWANRSVWLDLSETDCTPDGGAIDEQGNIWLAIWGGAAIHKYSPAGKLLDKIQLQALQPTSCAFGGPDMEFLLITTATEGLSEQQMKDYPDSGKVLQYHQLIKGKPMPHFKLEVASC